MVAEIYYLSTSIYSPLQATKFRLVCW